MSIKQTIQQKKQFKFNFGSSSLIKTEKAIIPEIIINPEIQTKFQELTTTINNLGFSKIIENVSRQSNLNLLGLEELKQLKEILQTSQNPELIGRQEDLEFVYIVLETKIEKLEHPVTINVQAKSSEEIQNRIKAARNN